MYLTDSIAGSAWTRILHLGGDAWLGLVRGVPFIGDYEVARRRVDLERPTGLLPCLERPRAVVISELRSRELELGLGGGTLETLVPLDAILAEAVASEMDYWVHLALGWLSETPGNSRYDALLAAVESAPWATQQSRHRAAKLR
jgi:hypothetical protein